MWLFRQEGNSEGGLGMPRSPSAQASGRMDQRVIFTELLHQRVQLKTENLRWCIICEFCTIRKEAESGISGLEWPAARRRRADHGNRPELQCLAQHDLRVIAVADRRVRPPNLPDPTNDVRGDRPRDTPILPSFKKKQIFDKGLSVGAGCIGRDTERTNFHGSFPLDDISQFERLFRSLWRRNNLILKS